MARPSRKIRSFAVEPAGANHYVIVSDAGLHHGPFEASDPQTIIRVARDYASGQGWPIVEEPHGGVGRYELEGAVAAPTIIAPALPAQLTVRLPAPAAEAVARTLEETGDTPGSLVAKALGLYMLALDARKRGKVVGAADSADVLDTEFTGF